MSFEKVGKFVNNRNEYGIQVLGAKFIDDKKVPDGQDLYIHEPVKLPKYVADWINYVLNETSIDKEQFLTNIDRTKIITDASDDVWAWYSKTENSSLIVAEAVLYGYEIEDEK
ncbi:MAG: DUF1642 domain-containing protein [Oenococcus sp.]|uniref:DUF1642 domain-containing protein n=1 Tax=Oenococcus sp. TaxID=1979414 RepID=UPI0039EA3B26